MKVLVVDDSKVIQLVIAECVKSMGHEIFFAENGALGLEHIKQNEVDLVLMDVEMPVMNGFEATQAIRQIDQDNWFPIIFLSTRQDDESFVKGILAGADAYLLKPINPLRLQYVITAMERIYTMRQKLSIAQEKLTKANIDLKKLALFDQLTELANRRNFDETLDRQFRLASRNKVSLSLIICDIDFFKLYNDHYGHQQGDDCLVKVAKVIASVLGRPTDKACRYGGEEFTVILPDTKFQSGLLIAEKIRLAVLDSKLLHEGTKNTSYVTLSLGLATYTGQYANEDELVKVADDALYRAKDKGRNRVESIK